MFSIKSKVQEKKKNDEKEAITSAFDNLQDINEIMYDEKYKDFKTENKEFVREVMNEALKNKIKQLQFEKKK